MTDTSAASNPIDSLLPLIASAIAEWKAKNNEHLIKEKVTTQLDKEAKQIMLKLLGFKDEYGGYQLDYCNGRAGESSAGDFLRRTQADAIKTWLSTVAMPSLSPKEEGVLRGSMQKEYFYRFKAQALQSAKQQAEADAKELIQQISKSMQADNYAKLLQLIEGAQ